jgi:hypothetical protein
MSKIKQLLIEGQSIKETMKVGAECTQIVFAVLVQQLTD